MRSNSKRIVFDKMRKQGLRGNNTAGISRCRIMKYNIVILLLIFSVSCKQNVKSDGSTTIAAGTDSVSENSTDTNTEPTIKKDTPKFTAYQQKPNGVIFNVDSVEIADTLLVSNDPKKVFENKIGKEITYFPEEHSKHGAVNGFNNCLIQTVQECYDNHRPLILSPDAIWLAVCQGVAIHINQNYDSLKNVIFIADKPDEIIIRNDSLEYSSKHWTNLIEALSLETKKYTNDDFYSFFVPEFSTTNSISKTAFQVTLLNSFNKAFKYIGESGCGIPSITVTGKKEDWTLILKNLKLLDKIGLSYWADELRPIIKQFINASQNETDPVFWKDIYKNASEYGGFYISGWIIKFFPYTKELASEGEFDNRTGLTKIAEIYKKNEFLGGYDYLTSTLSTDNFPSGIVKIPVTWNDHINDTIRDIEIYAGFFAIKQYSDKTLEPLISWAICDKNSKSAEHELIIGRTRYQEYKPEYWSPHFAQDVTDSAVYDIKTFKTHKASIAYIKSILADSLQNSIFSKEQYSGKTIKIQILSNGTVGKVLPEERQDDQLADYIKKILSAQPGKWFPALTHPSEILGDVAEDENKIKVRANSVVKIDLD